MLLKGILPEKDYMIWSWIVLACQKVTKPFITEDEVSMFEYMILQFLRMFKKHFGSESVTLNMHLHVHLKDCMLDNGSIYGFWFFSSERYNVTLGSFPTN